MSELKPCPFCGGAAHFFKITDLDDRNFGGDGICCGSCPVTTDLMFSLMEDCKPKLAEAWNRRAQPAQAGQVLTDDEIDDVQRQTNAAYYAGTLKDRQHSRAIEQAVLAKRVPMTEAQIEAALWGPHPAEVWCRDFRAGVRAAERHHGIVGEKGGAT